MYRLLKHKAYAAKSSDESQKESTKSHISTSVLIFTGIKQSFDVDDETQTNHKIMPLFQRQSSPKFVAVTSFFGLGKAEI